MTRRSLTGIRFKRCSEISLYAVYALSEFYDSINRNFVEYHNYEM